MKFFNKAHYGAYILAVCLGLIGKEMALFFPGNKVKLIFSIAVSIVYIIYFLVIEKRALKLLGQEAGKISFSKQSPLLKMFLFQLITILIGGWFVYSTFKLSSMISFLTFPFLVYFFIGGLFETHRLLRM